ncbi:uncharacterized protein EKO05_0008084 [Ascochyta rabiei]|uniref:uncharacterized protein n=1 Tax=Didymella rabiei TaxID=5454 RepID=UPI0021F956EA|nr:uncharacterized protein EKO05_0008084 [Ascochyta rabiei]UPX17744.1 hypothetical protein EKO05_0008084 [Ascochyta rabiei]
MPSSFSGNPGSQRYISHIAPRLSPPSPLPKLSPTQILHIILEVPLEVCLQVLVHSLPDDHSGNNVKFKNRLLDA